MQVFQSKESIGNLTKTGNITVQLAASVITVGANQYTTNNLICTTTTAGAAGLDTGAIAANALYYVYAVVSAGAVVLVASLSATNPMGFGVSKKVGSFKTDASTFVYFIRVGNSSTTQKFLSGSGTYITPNGCLYIKVTVIGGGGGGGGNSSNGPNNIYPGIGGSNSSFGGTLIVATGGSGGKGAQGGVSFLGGVATINSPAIGMTIAGGIGQNPSGYNTQGTSSGTNGGVSIFNGGGSGGNDSNGEVGMANTGAGGGGAGGLQFAVYNYGASGGSAGGAAIATIINPSSNYAYVIGAGGNGTGGNNYTGGSGGSGIIIVEEFYV